MANTAETKTFVPSRSSSPLFLYSTSPSSLSINTDFHSDFVTLDLNDLDLTPPSPLSTPSSSSASSLGSVVGRSNEKDPSDDVVCIYFDLCGRV